MRQSSVMTEAERPKPQWHLPLNGLPCDHCWEPAAYLVVFEEERLVLHVNRELPACRGVNPAPPTPKQVRYPMASRPKRKVGRPKQKKSRA